MLVIDENSLEQRIHAVLDNTPLEEASKDLVKDLVTEAIAQNDLVALCTILQMG